LIGAIVLASGQNSGNADRRGKTLAAVFPAYLNALRRRECTFFTFNDYLAKRDAQWMGPVYEFLGLTVGYVQEEWT